MNDRSEIERYGDRLPYPVRPRVSQEIHVHHHYGPAEGDSVRVVDKSPTVLDKMTPYFVVLLYGMVIASGCVGIVAAAGAFLIPLITSLLASVVGVLMAIAACLGMLAVMAVGVAAGVRHLRETPAKPKKKR